MQHIGSATYNWLYDATDYDITVLFFTNFLVDPAFLQIIWFGLLLYLLVSQIYFYIYKKKQHK